MAEIAISGVRKSYGKNETVHGIDLTIEKGEFVVILGPSGCGKSTLLRMIAGLEEITAGEISIGGKVVNRLEPRERGCAMVFQNYALYPHMTVAENIGYGLKVAGVPKAERRQRIETVAKTLGLAEFLDRRPAALSGGQRQRVAMGRAMIREPQVFLFDEPLSNLDAKLRVQMRVEIKRLHQRLNATSVFVTHDQVEAMTLADKLVVLNKGAVEQVGSPSEVYRNPASKFVADFIGSPPMNFLQARVDGHGLLALKSGRRLSAANANVAVPGADLTIGFRPEEVEVARESAPDTFDFDVEMVEELGAGQLLHGRMAETETVIALPSGTADASTRRLSVRLPPSALHLFDGRTGRRINAPTELIAAE